MSRDSVARAPVAFFIFNRPTLTERVFAAIAAARPPCLLVVGDGPRENHPDDVRLVAHTRGVIDRVDWPCEVRTCYSEVNLGCKLRVSSGLDWVFSQVDEAIIIEDDCLPDGSFFRFAEELLDRYRDTEQVHMVAGSNVLAPRRFSSDSYYFSRCYTIWGWATWARAWSHYDLEMRQWPEVRDTTWLVDLLGGKPEARVATDIFDRTYAGLVPTWDFQWVFGSWLAGGVSVTPAVNLVTNLGYGELATNERAADHPLARRATSPMAFPLRHPNLVAVNDGADRSVWRFAYPDYFDRQRSLTRNWWRTLIASRHRTRDRR